MRPNVCVSYTDEFDWDVLSAGCVNIVAGAVVGYSKGARMFFKICFPFDVRWKIV